MHKVPPNQVLEEVQIIKTHVTKLETEILSKYNEIMSKLSTLISLHQSEHISRKLQEQDEKDGADEKHDTSLVQLHSADLKLSTSSPQEFFSQCSSFDLTEEIPQLDGKCDSPQGFPQAFQCENCGMLFNLNDDLDNHNDSHQFGCDKDECDICFTSKYLADLHELESHPETSYARDHIPQSTKEDFANGRRYPG